MAWTMRGNNVAYYTYNLTAEVLTVGYNSGAEWEYDIPFGLFHAIKGSDLTPELLCKAISLNNLVGVKKV